LFAGGELGVENVDGVRGDLRDVDVVERSQVAGDDPSVLLERVRRPTTLLHGDQLRGQLAEGLRRRNLIGICQLDGPAVALRLGVPLPCGPNDTRAVTLLASERVPAEIGT
jgi:hypothetical protein